MVRGVPVLLEKILSHFLPSKDREFLLGNYEYLFEEIENKQGYYPACLWYIFHVMKSIPVYTSHRIYWGAVMFSSYLKMSWRNFVKFKMYTLINIFGLATGLSACIFILLWVQDELSYDDFHTKSERIFRTEQKYFREDESEQWPITSGAYGPTLVEEYPEIINYTRFWKQRYTFKDYRNSLNQYNIVLTDNNTFDIFDFYLLEGDKNSALKDPGSVVMTPGKAMQLFGTEDVVGRTLPWEQGDRFADLKVTGLLAPLPHNSHMQFDILISLSTFEGRNVLDHFKWNFLYTYILLEENTAAEELEQKFSSFMFKHRFSETHLAAEGITPDQIDNYVKLKLKNVSDIHLDPCYEWEIGPQGNVESVYMFSSIAVLILIIACINFINLSTARARKKAKEVGMRKVIGAYTHQLWKQFLSESLIISVISLFISLCIIVLLIPLFNQLSGKFFTIHSLFNVHNVILLLIITLSTGLLSGIYPAFYLSSFSPAEIFKGNKVTGHKRSVFRKYLVVTQFVISIALIISTITIHDQMNYIQNKSMGFDEENVIVIPARSKSVRSNAEVLRDRLIASSYVQNVAVSSNTPGDNIYGDRSYEVNESGKSAGLTFMSVGYDFIDTYGIELLAGRSFSRDFGTDTSGTLIINETALKKYGITAEEMLTRKLNGTQVVGVVKDFHFKSLHKEVEPLALILEPERVGYISLRLSKGNYKTILAEVEEVWKDVNSGMPFEFSFLDERLNQQYLSELKTNKLFVIFAALSIFVACLVLFGLAAFTTEEKTKEIGVRKVLGASIPVIFIGLIKQFTKWVLIANIIAWPMAYYMINQWLENFAYRIEIDLWPYMIAAVTAMTIAVVTVSFQAVKAAVANPVESLNYE